jgi:hypothetical protein
MNKTFTILSLLLISILISNAQQWVQTTSTPEGSGITDLTVRYNGSLFAVTASYNWPNGESGGVYRSMDDGGSWDKVYEAFTARTILDAPDGNLYASVWDFPASEGLYRSEDNGESWDELVNVPTGNNIFSIAVGYGDNSNYIFAGTRTGILKSSDYGATWGYSNSGMTENAWVSDLKIDYDGVLATATDKGLYLSYDFGGLWQKAANIPDSDTATQVSFNKDHFYVGLAYGRLAVATARADLYMSDFDDYFALSKVNSFGISYTSAKIKDVTIEDEEEPIYISGFSLRPKAFKNSIAGAGFYLSTDNWETFQQYNDGLPVDPIVSSISGMVLYPESGEVVKYYMGLFGNSPGGATVYSITFDNPVGIKDNSLAVSGGNKLFQNYPNPVQQTTTISYYLDIAGQTTIELYSLNGKLVKTFLDEWKPQGENNLIVNTGNLKAGVYYYKLQTGNSSKVRKMIVLE